MRQISIARKVAADNATRLEVLQPRDLVAVEQLALRLQGGKRLELA